MNDSLLRQETVNKVLAETRKNIILGRYRAGEQLSESMISQQYHVSRSSVRTAFQALEHEGLLESLSNGRKVIKLVDERYVKNICATRSILECEAARTILAMPNPDLSQLFFILGKILSATQHPDIEESKKQFAEYNSAFHEELFEIADNVSLKQCWKTISPVIDALVGINTAVDYIFTSQNHYEDHYAIAEMLSNKNNDVIELVRYHAFENTSTDALSAIADARRAQG